MSINVNGRWFEMRSDKNTVTMSSRLYGRYTGMVINTMSGKQVLFSHNGHRYQGKDAVETFRRMVEREVR